MRNATAFIFTLAFLVSACDQQAPSLDAPSTEAPQISLRVPGNVPSAMSDAASAKKSDDDDRTAAAQAYIEQMNADLASRGLGIAIHKVEWVGGGEGHEAGQTVFANDRTLRLGAQWVPGDERRDATGNTITHVVDQSFASANVFNPAPVINAEPAIDASFDTWDDMACSKLDIVKKEDIGLNYSPQFNFTGEQTDPFYADISTVGFLPSIFFEVFVGPGASTNVLGVTFTFIFGTNTPDGFVPSDINNDGFEDIALKEVWYNDAFLWSTDGGPGIDIETVALHENGHALGLGHFGKVSVTSKNNKLHVSPRASMNAIILGDLREPLGTDNGAYCGLYGSWPS